MKFNRFSYNNCRFIGFLFALFSLNFRVRIVSLDQLVAVVAFRGRQSFGDGPAACLQGSFEVLFG